MNLEANGAKRAAIDVVAAFTHESNGTFVSTHARFSLGEDFLVSPNLPGEGRKRLLVTPASEADDEIRQMLTGAGVAQFTRFKHLHDHDLWSIPVQAKPLANERVFGGRQSSDTYVSDHELYEGLGKLWRDVFRATGGVPVDDPLTKTAILDFSGVESRLLPVPAYGRWLRLDQSQEPEALNHFLKELAAQLDELSTEPEHNKDLVQAAKAGWEREEADEE